MGGWSGREGGKDREKGGKTKYTLENQKGVEEMTLLSKCEMFDINAINSLFSYM